jgi:hypothetical protein
VEKLASLHPFGWRSHSKVTSGADSRANRKSSFSNQPDFNTSEKPCLIAKESSPVWRNVHFRPDPSKKENSHRIPNLVISAIQGADSFLLKEDLGAGNFLHF